MPEDNLQYEYFINLDERGEFYADVRDSEGKTVFEMFGFDMFEDGFMAHKKDIAGLGQYLRDVSIIPESADLISSN